MYQEFKDRKEERKQKGNVHAYSMNIDHEYQLTHNELDRFNRSSAYIIVFEPDKDNCYPFSQEQMKMFPGQPEQLSIGFLSDENLLIKNDSIFSLFVRSEQIDRIRHYMKNIANDGLYQSVDTEDVQKPKKVDNVDGGQDREIFYNARVAKNVELSEEQMEKIKFFHVFMFNMLYASESSFFKGLFNATYVFDRLLRKTLQIIKKDILMSGIFENT